MGNAREALNETKYLRRRDTNTVTMSEYMMDEALRSMMPTFLALKSHPRLQVIHLKLQPFEGTVGVSRLSLISN